MQRLRDFTERLLLGFRLLPIRWRRLRSPLSPSVIDTALGDRLFQLLDGLLITDLYEAFSNLLALGTRRLTVKEERVLRTVFAGSLPYHAIRVDERARLGPRRFRFCYVSFHTINGWGKMSPPLLVHEAMHVWQYVHRGACYIPRALAAQRSQMGYDYGGGEALARAEVLDEFNYEQMASLIEDSYRVAHGWPVRHLNADVYDGNTVFTAYLKQLRESSLPVVYHYRSK